MLFSLQPAIDKRDTADIILLPYWEKGEKAKPAAASKEFDKIADPLTSLKDFSGKEGESSLIYFPGKKEKRALLIGLGKEEKISCEILRRIYGTAAKLCQKKNFKNINLVLPNIVELRRITLEECLKGICEGILLVNYKWSQKSTKSPESLIEHVTLLGVLPKVAPEINDLVQIAEGVYLARDLINGNADVVTPGYLVNAAKKLSQRFPAIKTTHLSKKELEKEKFGLLLAVGRGSCHDPALICMEYQGNPKSKEKVALIGKGITYDTGGLNIKPAVSMETMRDDMSGGATVLATLGAIAALNLKVNVVGVIPSAENAVDGNSYKTGDVYTSYSGKTVEIKDTDAEGRLVLADALSYTVKLFKPTQMIDLATLTGSVIVALGDSISGLYSNDDRLSDALLESSHRTSELLWRLPLHQPYKEMLKSDIADLKNVGGRHGGSIIAALFLEEFVANTPWAHLDIAGVAFSSKEQPYLPKNGIGFGVRLLVDFFKRHK